MIFLDGDPIDVTLFPDKTSQVWKIDPAHLNKLRATIEWKFESEAEFMHLAQLKDLLDANDVRVSLNMPYLPYGRQDKNISNYETFSLRTFCGLLSYLRFELITVYDAHSSLPSKILYGFKSCFDEIYVEKIIADLKIDQICFPDSGALHKYRQVLHYPTLYGIKSRDHLTGKLLKYHLEGDPRGKSILIVDDICDGGATFIGLADLLRTNGAEKIHLYVSHGLFTKGIEPLRAAGIEKIFTKEGEIDDSGHIIHRFL